MTAKTKPNLKAQAQLKARLQRKAGMRLSEEIRQKVAKKHNSELKIYQNKIKKNKKEKEDALRPKANLLLWHGRIGCGLFGGWYLLTCILFNSFLSLVFYLQSQDFMFDEYEMIKLEFMIPFILIIILILYFQIVLVIQRLHDHGLEGWWGIFIYLFWIGYIMIDGLFSTVFNYLEIVCLFFLFVFSGDNKRNKFGIIQQYSMATQTIGQFVYMFSVIVIVMYYIVIWSA